MINLSKAMATLHEERQKDGMGETNVIDKAIVKSLVFVLEIRFTGANYLIKK